MSGIKQLLGPASSAMDLYSAELHECHRLLDQVGITQSGFEEQLSISQRVAQAVSIIINLRHPMSVDGKRIGI